MAFGFGFITLMFLGFVLGYMLGKYILEWDQTRCLLLSLAVGITSFILEIILFIIKMEKMDMLERKSEEREEQRLKKLN